jgi:hypothetical protein
VTGLQRDGLARNTEILVVAERLGARLKKAGGEWVGPCPRCGGRDRFAINPRKRLFNCRGCRVGGDAIDLLRLVTGSTFAEAAELIGDRPTPSTPANQNDYNPAASIRRIVAGLTPILGSPGERYLRDTRGIDTTAIADLLQRTDAIGWNPSVYFNEPGHPLHGQKLGCIVGIMTNPATAQPTGAISRTYIDKDLNKIGKAKTLGEGGGVVRLSRDEDTLEGLFLAEGLETALAAAAHTMLAARPIWSTGSDAAMRTFPVLAGIGCLNIIADNDAKGAGERAARDAAERWLDAGREVRIIRPKTKGEDLNDIVKRKKWA